MKLSLQQTQILFRVFCVSLLVGVAHLFADVGEFGLIVAGLSLVLMSMVVLLNHKLIWENYLESYTNRESRLLQFFLSPNSFGYKFNIYFLWPTIFLLGLVILYLGFTQETVSLY